MPPSPPRNLAVASMFSLESFSPGITGSRTIMVLDLCCERLRRFERIRSFGAPVSSSWALGSMCFRS